MRRVKPFLALAAVAAALFPAFPALSRQAAARYSLEKAWEVPLDGDFYVIRVAACPDGSAYVADDKGTLRWVSPDGVLSPATTQLPMKEIFILAACDAKHSVYLSGSRLWIFDAALGGASSLAANILPDFPIERLAVLPDGSVWVKYPAPSDPRRKRHSPGHFAHDGSPVPRDAPLLTEYQVQALPGVIWSESRDTAKNEQEFRLDDGTSVTQSIAGSEIADVFKRLLLTIREPSNHAISSTIESDKDGVLSAASTRDSLFFLSNEAAGHILLRRFRLLSVSHSPAQTSASH